MTLSNWTPTENKKPSPTNKGSSDTDAIYLAVGFSLSRWEHMEMGLIRLFQLLCETPSFAACRAYGTLESSFAKVGMLRASANAFFGGRNAIDSEYHKDIKALFAAYEKAQQYRNNIAHGIAVGYNLPEGGHSGYFLCPPSYSTKKIKNVDSREIYLLGASYWYTADDILHYGKRFENMLAEVMRLISAVNAKYSVLKDSQFHP